jgi:hypothetical protein
MREEGKVLGEKEHGGGPQGETGKKIRYDRKGIKVYKERWLISPISAIFITNRLMATCLNFLCPSSRCNCS